MKIRLVGFVLLCAVAINAPLHARVSDATVDRTAGTLQLRWNDSNPVDVYVSNSATLNLKQAQLIASGDPDGEYALPAPAHERPYFLLKDRKDNTVMLVAERVLPLEQGSNFRDLGGYPAANGKHVRWGLLFRSGATPLLTEQDLAKIDTLGLQQMIDLRAAEERVFAPTRISGVPYSAVGYSFASVMNGGKFDMEGVYRNFPGMLAPQMRMLFASLLRKEAPIAVNCSAGQDRTGFASALILTALNVPRPVIYADYELSTMYRKPEFEMVPIDPAQHPNDPFAQIFARMGSSARKPQPLVGQDGQPFLAFAFDEMDKKWGSPEAYLKQELGIGSAQLALLRKLYLE